MTTTTRWRHSWRATAGLSHTYEIDVTPYNGRIFSIWVDDADKLPWNKRLGGASATRGGCSMDDERGRATGEAEGAGCGALLGLGDEQESFVVAPDEASARTLLASGDHLQASHDLP